MFSPGQDGSEPCGGSVTKRFRRIVAAAAAWGLAGIGAALAGPADDLSAYRRPTEIPFPADNRYSFEKAQLGKALFFDPRLSGAQNMTCASCHNPSFGWQVPVRTAIGANGVPLKRRAPTLLNAAWGTSFFGDGRAATLEVQARLPIEAKTEMALPLSDAVNRLRALPEYAMWFARVFPGEGVTPTAILMAIATYERTIVSSYAPFDEWVAGKHDAIRPEAIRGFELFSGRAGCAQCHSGWNFTDNRYHDIGLSSADRGRGALEPANPKAQYAFKTPTLRDITLRAPFMHDGSLATLAEVVDHYSRGGIARPSKAALVRRLDLSAEDRRALISFLESLAGEKPQVRLPVLPN